MTHNKQQNIWVPAGRLFYIAEGEYSDFMIQAHFVALEDITEEKLFLLKEKIREKILSDSYEPNTPYRDLKEESCLERESRENFMREFIASGLVLEVDCREIHIGSYGTLRFNSFCRDD